MEPLFDCTGDPRAMGHTQGLVCQQAIRAALEAADIPMRRRRIPTLFALTRGHRLGRGAGRELIRHYTHIAERMAGIARRADVPFESIVELFCRSTSPPDPSELLFAPGAAIALAGAGTPIVMRTLGGDAWPATDWVLRRSRPEVGFVSVEVTLPWLATSIAGINEAGVSVAVIPRSASYDSGVLAGAVNARHAPHAILLVQECLQRFEDLEGCLDWTTKRPRAGNVSLVLADAAGRVARVEIEGTATRVVDLDSAYTLDGPTDPLAGALHANLERDPALGTESSNALAESLGALCVWLEPAERRLSIRSLRAASGEGKTVEISL